MPSPERVLLVDDDALLRASLGEQLAREGSCTVVAAGSAAEARLLAGEGHYRAAIIDQNLPDGRGDTLMHELKAHGFDAPVLILSEPGAPLPGDADGAVDYLEKPFRFSALLARLNLYLNRHAASDDAPMTIGPYLFRPGAKLLTMGARRVHLTEKETDILKFLHAAGATVTRETLLHEVWGYNPAVTTHTLETHIYRLRKKIEDGAGGARILFTEGGGYRLAT